MTVLVAVNPTLPPPVTLLLLLVLAGSREVGEIVGFDEGDGVEAAEPLEVRILGVPVLDLPEMILDIY